MSKRNLCAVVHARKVRINRLQLGRLYFLENDCYVNDTIRHNHPSILHVFIKVGLMVKVWTFAITPLT